MIAVSVAESLTHLFKTRLRALANSASPKKTIQKA
jgi:hypothetical protein